MKGLFTLMLLIPSTISFYNYNNFKKVNTKYYQSDLVPDVSPIVDYDIKSMIENGPIARSDRVFVIDGWRWHTKSVLRDLNRFEVKLNLYHTILLFSLS